MAVTETTIAYPSSIGSLEDLQEDVNADERTSRCKLQSLELGENERGEKATLGFFKKTDRQGLGNLRFENADDSDGDGAILKGDCFVLTQEQSVVIFRD